MLYIVELPIEYSRDALKYLIRKSIDLKDKQCEIITGALEFKDRHIKDIMMPLDRVFMISANEKLDFETMAVIYSSGFSRIPVYENVRNDIIGKY
jgi:metal transporter CNNM